MDSSSPFSPIKEAEVIEHLSVLLDPVQNCWICYRKQFLGGIMPPTWAEIVINACGIWELKKARVPHSKPHLLQLLLWSLKQKYFSYLIVWKLIVAFGEGKRWFGFSFSCYQIFLWSSQFCSGWILKDFFPPFSQNLNLHSRWGVLEQLTGWTYFYTKDV